MTHPSLTLNVGGIRFETSVATLQNSKEDSFFSSLVQHLHSEQREVFLDRDGTHFRHILNWLRGSFTAPMTCLECQELQKEAEFYCLQEMLPHLKQRCDSLRRQRQRVVFE